MRDRLGLVALAGTILTGIWLLVAPFVLALGRAAEVSHLATGPIVASVGVISLAMVVRRLVRVNVLAGGWLILAPFLVDHGRWWAESVLAGAIVAALALVPRGDPARFGGGWRSLLAGERGHPPASAPAEDPGW